MRALTELREGTSLAAPGSTQAPPPHHVLCVSGLEVERKEGW